MSSCSGVGFDGLSSVFEMTVVAPLCRSGTMGVIRGWGGARTRGAEEG